MRAGKVFCALHDTHVRIICAVRDVIHVRKCTRPTPNTSKKVMTYSPFRLDFSVPSPPLSPPSFLLSLFLFSTSPFPPFLSYRSWLWLWLVWGCQCPCSFRSSFTRIALLGLLNSSGTSGWWTLNSTWWVTVQNFLYRGNESMLVVEVVVCSLLLINTVEYVLSTHVSGALECSKRGGWVLDT